MAKPRPGGVFSTSDHALPRNKVGLKLVEAPEGPWEANMDIFVRSEGSGFLAGSLIAVLLLATVFLITMAY